MPSPNPTTRREYKGAAAATTLSAPIAGGSDTSFTLTAATNWPTGSVGNFIVTVDRGLATEERVLCASRSGTSITVASSGRGFDGTTAQAHANAATVECTLSAFDADEWNAHTAASSAVHGVTGTFVGTTDTQVLTNKTLQSAAFTGTATGTVPQAVGHGTPDTDAAPTSLHHTLGTATLQAAAGDHDHSSVKLAQANTHQTPDTDTGLTSLHHTLGTGANQAAAGDHGHTDISDSGWSTYTPSLSGITLGNGTVAGRYKQIGKTVRFTAKVTLGSTTTVGAANTVSLPVTASASAADIVGTGHLFDTSAGAHYPALFTISASGTATSTIYTQATTFWPAFNSGSPFTWAVGDTITVSGFYEV